MIIKLFIGAVLVAGMHGPVGRQPEPAAIAPEGTLRLLTRGEYENTVADLLGEGLIVGPLEPDVAVDGLAHVGAATHVLSQWGVEQYEESALLLARQVMTNARVRLTVMGCTPIAQIQDPCTREFVKDFGRLAWRRPLETDEVDSVMWIADEAATAYPHDPWAGPEFALVRLLQSPFFLYRVEVGSEGVYRGEALASRLAYFLWAGPPDESLLETAALGYLDNELVYASEVDRLMADPRAQRGIERFFSEWLGLDSLEGPVTEVSQQVLASARQETLRTIDHHVRSRRDVRDLLTTARTFVDPTLADLYGIPAPNSDGFAPVSLPSHSIRRGLLGHASTLIRTSHPERTSPTRRGKFIRNRLLCQDIPPPPPGVNTSVPPANPHAPTVRDRLAEHTAGGCATCHDLMDPLGFPLEVFDATGAIRAEDGGAPIDPSGHVDGIPVDDAVDLGNVLRNHPRLVNCLVRRTYAHAHGHTPSPGEQALVDWHLFGLVKMRRHDWVWLMRDIALSEGFRNAGSD